jgi:hypothetical protein
MTYSVSDDGGQVTDRVRKKREDSLLEHCLLRAAIADLGGWEKAEAKLEAGTVKANSWLGVKATPKASRVASFIVLWTIGMRDEGHDSYSITEYQRYWNEGERQAYRLQNEFRELWPEFHTPNELAQQLLKQLHGKVGKREAMSLPLKLQVTA